LRITGLPILAVGLLSVRLLSVLRLTVSLIRLLLIGRRLLICSGLPVLVLILSVGRTTIESQGEDDSHQQDRLIATEEGPPESGYGGSQHKGDLIM